MHFRNYASLRLTPNQGTTVLYGANGSGKTNLLEAMHLLSIGRSHRTAADREMIAEGEKRSPLCRAKPTGWTAATSWKCACTR